MSDLQVAAQIPGRQQPAQRDAIMDVELAQNDLDMRLNRSLRNVQLSGNLAGRVAPANVGCDLLLAWGELLPTLGSPRKRILVLNGLFEKLRSDFFRRTLLALGDQAQVFIGVDVHRKNAFTMQPIFQVA